MSLTSNIRRLENEAGKCRRKFMWVSTFSLLPAVASPSMVVLLIRVGGTVPYLTAALIIWVTTLVLGVYLYKLWDKVDYLEDKLQDLRLIQLRERHEKLGYKWELG